MSANPESTAALEAPIAAPKASASGGIILSNCSLDFRPRPPETTREAVARSGRSDFWRSSEIQVVGHGALGSVPSSIFALLEPSCAAGKAVPRIVIIFMGSVDWTVRIALPA